MSEKYLPPFKEPEQECLDPIIAATKITETQDEHKDDTSSSFNQPTATKPALTENPSDERQQNMTKKEFLALLGLVPTESVPSIKKKQEESRNKERKYVYYPPCSSADKDKKNYLQVRPRGCPPKPNEFRAKTISKTDTMSPPKDGCRPTSSSYEGKELNSEELTPRKRAANDIGIEELTQRKRAANDIENSEWETEFEDYVIGL